MTKKQNKPSEHAYFAGGCFWGMQYHFGRVPGVLKTKVGYTGGSVDHPTYEQVCSGKTGHTETLDVLFDPTVTSYEILARLFFEIHDPTQMNRQGPDVGPQYRSAIFYLNENQKKIAETLISILKKKGYDVVTAVEKAKTFWPAETYHQDYYSKNGHTPYCYFYTKRF